MEPAIPMGSAIVVAPVAAARPARRRRHLAAGRRRPRALHPPDHRGPRPARRPLGPDPGRRERAADPTLVHASAIEGRVDLAIPLAGYLIALLSIPMGVLFLIGVAATLLAAVWLLESLELDQVDRVRVCGRPAATARRRRADLGPPGRGSDRCRGGGFGAGPAVGRRPDRAVPGDARAARPMAGRRHGSRRPPPRTEARRRLRRRIVALGFARRRRRVAAATAPSTLARFTDQDASTLSLSTDTLAPPTGLAATGRCRRRSRGRRPSTRTRPATRSCGARRAAAATPSSTPSRPARRPRRRTRRGRDLLLRPALVLPELAERRQQRGVRDARARRDRLQGAAPPPRTPPTRAATTTATS